MGNLLDALKQDHEVTAAIYQVLDEYHIMKHQIKRIQALIIRIDNSGLYNTAELLRDALNGEIGL